MSGRDAVVRPWVERPGADPDELGVATATVDRGTLLVAAAAGLVGPVVLVMLGEAAAHWIPIGVAFGVAVAALTGARAVDPGRGLVWAVGLGALTWLGVLGGAALGVPGAPADVDSLVFAFFMLAVGVGLPVGVGTGLWHARRDATDREPIAIKRAVVVGSAAGLVGGVAFSVWMHQVGMLPLIAGLVGATDPAVGLGVHFVISVIIGFSYGLLFQRDARGFGSSLAWGMAYGFVWWVLGGLTLFPLLLGDPLGWTAYAAREYVGFLVGHLVYGLLLGGLYAVLDRAWLVLFYESDPLNYDVDGASLRTLESMGWGLLASLAGVVLLGIVLLESGELTVVAGLVGAESRVVGAVVLVVVGSVIGMGYGRLFRYESPTVGAGVMWGVVYGFLWWIIGPLTLLPVALGEGFSWGLAALVDGLPWLVGLYLYGAATGAGFYWLEQRRKAWGRVNPRIAAHERRRQRRVGTPAPATWLIVLVVSVVLVLLL